MFRNTFASIVKNRPSSDLVLLFVGSVDSFLNLGFGYQEYQHFICIDFDFFLFEFNLLIIIQ